MNRLAGCILRLLLLAVTMGSTPQAPAQTSTALPVALDSFFRNQQFAAAAINPGPSGQTHVAFLREIKGRMNLVVMDLGTRQLNNVAGYERADVVDFQWINAERLIYRLADLSEGLYDSGRYGVFAIDRDGNRPYTLSEGLASFSGTVGSGTRGLPARGVFAQRVRSGDLNDFIAAVVTNQPYGLSYLRINSRNGTRKPIESAGLGNVIDAAFDYDDVMRAVATADKGKVNVYVRDNASAPWRGVAEFDLYGREGFYPVRFDRKGNLYVAVRTGSRETQAIHRFDWATGKPEAEALIAVKDFDIGDGMRFDDSGALIGVDYVAATEGTHWIEPQWKAQQERVDVALPERVNRLSGRVNGHIVVHSYSDRHPSRYYLFDTLLQKLQLLGASRPWIDDKLQARSSFVRYPARDGLVVPALLTLPRASDPKKLPLVLLVHGGPYVRGIDWRWNRERQFLASRGYAVLEPDFRGSTGHGWTLFRSGWKQWGLAMQDDLADGVAALVAQGVVDSNRVCIAGASYGGYAVVMGLIRHPDVYKCGISWVGVTDIEMLYTVGWSDTADSDWARYGMPVLVADRDKDKEQLKATSAVQQAARLKAPLIIAYGREDVRVPYDHGEKLRDALKPHNNQVQYIVYPNEGHGWRLLDTNVDFWTRAEKLLAEHIGRPPKE